MPRVIDKGEILRLRHEGKTIFEIARAVRCSDRTVSNTLKAAGVSTGQKKFFVSREQIAKLWFQELPLMEIAKRLGCSQATVSKIAHGHGLPRKAAVVKPIYVDPTPAEIAERAREIRERHYALRRAETDECARIKAWRHGA